MGLLKAQSPGGGDTKNFITHFGVLSKFVILTPGFTGGYKHFALSELAYPIFKGIFPRIVMEKKRRSIL